MHFSSALIRKPGMSEETSEHLSEACCSKNSGLNHEAMTFLIALVLNVVKYPYVSFFEMGTKDMDFCPSRTFPSILLFIETNTAVLSYLGQTSLHLRQF